MAILIFPVDFHGKKGKADRHRKKNKTGNVHITEHWGAFVQPMLQWKSNKYYILWMSVCSLKYLAWNAHAP